MRKGLSVFGYPFSVFAKWSRLAFGNHRQPITDNRKRRRAFTLVEVMLAITIAGVGLAVLLAAAARGVGIGKKAMEYEAARRLFDRLVYEEPIQLDDIEDDRDSGSFDRPYNNYRWERVIEEYGEEEDKLLRLQLRSAGLRFEVR